MKNENLKIGLLGIGLTGKNGKVFLIKNFILTTRFEAGESTAQKSSVKKQKDMQDSI